MTGSKQLIEGAVLLIATDDAAGHSLLHALAAATIEVEWARTLGELRERTARTDGSAPRLVFLDLDLPDAPSEVLVPVARSAFPNATTLALACEVSGERAAWLLSQGVASLTKPVSAMVLTGLALRILLGGQPTPSTPMPRWPRPAHAVAGATHLESMFTSYSTGRVLSKQQRMILRLYLDGMNDKEIALTCGCSEATVYEHWRRMARKAGGSHKGDVISDFHRFLDSRGP
ncbi:MAG: LuxR C-terminal-related transcriptional regulator [bacterium]